MRQADCLNIKIVSFCLYFYLEQHCYELLVVDVSVTIQIRLEDKLLQSML